MESSTGFRAEHAPLRSEPEIGQRAEYGSKSGWSKDAWRILQEDVTRSHIANDSGDIWPEPSLVLLPAPLAGDAERLAREPRSDDIHDATPRAAVERSEVTPDRRFVQATLRHTRDHDRGVIGFPFDVADGSCLGNGESHAELKSADAGT
ncbi:MAG: hypothetical protein OXG79_12655 [Chloroflexi bacterium]|nr:hypothetical protein [Chloroflexota bacterium]